MGKRSEGFERRSRGFYPTPLAAFEPLAPFVRGKHVLEPCAGDGALCYYLTDVGAVIVGAYDIEPQHPNIDFGDARELTLYHSFRPDLIVTNPPWPEPQRNGEPTLSIAKHLARLAPTWLLLPSDFMHNVYAAELMGYCHQIVSVGRVKWIEGSDSAGKDNCAWYLFDASRRSSGIQFTPRASKRRAA